MTTKINLGISMAIATLTVMVAATIFGGMNNADALRLFSPTTQTATSSSVTQSASTTQSNNVGSYASLNKVGIQANDASTGQQGESVATNLDVCDCTGKSIASPTTQTATSGYVSQSASTTQSNNVGGAFSVNLVGTQASGASTTQIGTSAAQNVIGSP